MNKKIKVIIIGVIILLLIGVMVFLLSKKENNNDEPNQLYCSVSEKNSENGFELKTEYFVDFDLITNEVTKSKISKTIVSNVEELTNYFKNNTLDNYRSMNERYGGITTETKSDSNNMTVIAYFDFTKVDHEAFLKDYPTLQSYKSIDGKLLLGGLRSLYEAEKASCEMIIK